jgi:hypothetical protein
MKTFPNNRISHLIQEKEKQGFRFSPDRSFYKKIRIRQKRWGILMRNEQPITTEELLKISEYFGFSYAEMIELNQKFRPRIINHRIDQPILQKSSSNRNP